MLTPKRIYVEELLDAGAGTEDDVAESLSDLRRINKFLGGSSVILKALRTTIKRFSDKEKWSLLDVGTGSADIPNEVIEWCEQQGIGISVAAVDLSERHLNLARTRLGIRPEVMLVRADGMQLPFPAKSIDFVTASLFLHHFRDEDVVRLLKEFARVARRRVIVNDLQRNLVPYYFIRFTTPIFATSPLTQYDGPVSVLRAFTAGELRDMACEAGFSRFTVKKLFPYRLLLVADCDGRAAG